MKGQPQLFRNAQVLVRIVRAMMAAELDSVWEDVVLLIPWVMCSLLPTTLSFLAPVWNLVLVSLFSLVLKIHIFKCWAKKAPTLGRTTLGQFSNNVFYENSIILSYFPDLLELVQFTDYPFPHIISLKIGVSPIWMPVIESGNKVHSKQEKWSKEDWVALNLV